MDALRQGHLEQTCPDCHRWEAAGRYCSGCFRRMTEADYYPNQDHVERAARGAIVDNAAARAARPATPPKRGRKQKSDTQ